MAHGITAWHSTNCRSREGGRCNCEPTYRAEAYDRRAGKKVRRSFKSMAEARSWRADAQRAIAHGTLRAPTGTTVREAWADWHEAAKSGAVRNRSGDVFRPASLRAYEKGMRRKVLPAVGSARLADLTRPDLQALVDRLLAEGDSPSTIGTALNGLRAIYRRALARGDLSINPCDGLQMPAVRGRRERIASPAEAAALLDALPEQDRPVWAVFFYAGLRRGEVQALRVENVSLDEGIIRVERNWDSCGNAAQLPKTDAARRRVPIPAVLRHHIMDRWLTLDSPTGLLFGSTPADAFSPTSLQQRADRAWKAAGLNRITPHECRHTFASLMIAAGVNAKALSTFMGHANISITLDRYSHLMPGAEDEAAGLLDSYLTAQLEREVEKARATNAA